MTDNPGPARRVPREEVRRRLLAEAVRVFTERGYVDARIEDIAHAAGRALAEVTERAGANAAVPPELAGLILHCLTNGLVNEHLADPDAVTADVIKDAFTAVLTALLPPPP